MTVILARDAQNFVDNIGVNTHLNWSNVPYTNLAQVEASANYLGVHTFRDDNNNATILNKVAADGFHIDMISNSNLTNVLSLAHNIEVAHPGAMRAIEGPNEVDNWPISYNGLSGYPASIAFQKDLYIKANADPVLANVDIFNVSVSSTTAESNLGNLAAYTDYANVHIYWGAGVPVWGWSQNDSTYWWTNWLKAAQVDAPGKPVVITEMGSTTAYLGGGGVDEITQAKELLNGLMTGVKNGASFMNIYELVESQQGDASNTEAHFGLFRWDWSAKPSATALHNFTTILTDGTGTVTGGSLDYTVSGVPASGGNYLFQEHDGTFDVVVWAEPDIWNENTHTAIAAPNSPMTVNFATAENVKVYDPMLGTNPIATYSNVTSVNVNVTDHPLIIEAKPVAVSPPPPPPPPPPPVHVDPTVTLSGSVTHVEGNSGSTDFAYTVTRTGDLTQASTVNYAVTPVTTNAADFVGGVLPPASSVSFAAGQATQQIHVAVQGDTTVEPNEQFTVTLSGFQGATAGATVAASGFITNDDVAISPPPPPPPPVHVDPTVTLSGDVTHAEGNSGATDFAYTVTRTGDLTLGSTINYAVTTPNMLANDFVGGTIIPAGSVAFAAGQATAQIHVAVQGDTTVEPNEQFTVTLVGFQGASAGSTVAANGFVTNDDSAVVVGQNVWGTAGNDSIVGTAGNDIMNAGTGNDTYLGLGGDDQLTGWRGADTFIFQPGFGHDTVMDFSHSEHDKLSFQGFPDGEISVVDTTNGMLLSDVQGDTVLLQGVHKLFFNDWSVS